MFSVNTCRALAAASVLLAAPIFMHIVAQVNDTPVAEIVETIEQTGKIKITQPAGMNSRLSKPKESTATDAALQHSASGSAAASSVGYRIQVFSDANAATAKNEAMVKERNILSRFPSLPTYISYKAPSWRLRVGDFRNREEAEEVLREIKSAFPSYSRELIIVRDKISLGQ